MGVLEPNFSSRFWEIKVTVANQYIVSLKLLTDLLVYLFMYGFVAVRVSGHFLVMS